MKSVIDKKVWQDWRNFEKQEASPGFFLELLTKVLASSPQLMSDLLAAHHQKDLNKVRYCAHTLSSSCKSLGAMSLGDLFSALENGCRAEPPVLHTQLMPALEKTFALFINEIQTEHDRLAQLLKSVS